MNKSIHKLLFFIFLSPTLVFSQANLWSEIDQVPLAQEGFLNDYTSLSEYQNFHLNFDAFKHQLSAAPNRDENIESNVFVTLPIGFNDYKSFKIYEVSTLSGGLAEKFPDIKSYVGISDNKTNSVRITLTNQGFFIYMSTKEGRFLINPINNRASEYIAFFRKDTKRVDGFLECLVIENNDQQDTNSQRMMMADVNDSRLRNYRLAVATTGEFSTFHVNQSGNQGSSQTIKKQAVMNAITVIIDRVNEIYERDASISFTLVSNNDQIIYLNSNTDPFSNFSPGNLINQSQQVIDSNIGNSNYDVGHTFSTGGGGLAGFGVVCQTGSKANGITGSPSPINDPYAIDYVCHELGHQFGGSHTFNSSSNGCVQQRENQTAVEPGSGSTIMGYAGLCAGQNVDFLSDALFHAVSINQIYNEAQSGSSCEQSVIITNLPPVIIPVNNYTIPKGTAFEIEVSANDVNGDQLTYTWDQIDNEITSVPPSSFSNQGALFKSYLPTTDNIRVFPRIQDVLNGNLTPQWEVIPSVARQINFAVTARDNNILGGQSDRDDMQINVVNQGPFEVTSQNTNGISYDQNNTVSVTWNVAGTDANGINAATVDIYLSYDGGLNFNTLLVSNVPNDGVQNVQIPIGTQSNSARIKIKPSDNIFFAVNSQNFVITNTIGTETINNNLFSLYPNPNNGSFNLSFENTGSYNVEIYDLRGRMVQHQEVENSLTKSIQLNNPSSGVYLVKVSNGSEKAVKKLIIQ